VQLPINRILPILRGFKAASLSSEYTLHRTAITKRNLVTGFTLLELLVVIVIIGLLAGLVAPRYFDQVGKSNTKIARAQINALEKALDQYRLDVGTYPITDPGLAALNTRPQNLEKWAGPYLKNEVPPDPWGARYLYKSPGDHGDYDLSSLGSDGQAGGTGEAADVTSWTR
jgi:general secretion pathway protein G